MKKVSLIITMIAIYGFCFAQYSVKLHDPKWSLNKTKEIYGNNITRLEGRSDMGSFLNIGYKTMFQKIQDAREKSNKEMWTKEQLAETIEFEKTVAAGGTIYISLGCVTIDCGNTEWYTVIIQDDNGNEVYRKPLKGSIPSVPGRYNNYWTNFSVVYIPEQIMGDFYVYVIDGLSSKKYKFLVHSN